MKAKWFPANNCYKLILGTDLTTANVIGLEKSGRRSWSTKKELREDLAYHGLKLGKGGIVTAAN